MPKLDPDWLAPHHPIANAKFTPITAFLNHIRLAESVKPKSAFLLSSLSKYQFNRVPFRLAQAPAYLQKLINDVLKGCNLAMGYLDDIIIYSRSEKEHLEHLEEIFSRLKAVGLKLKLEKCCYFKKHIQYLRHLIPAEGIQPLPEKLESIAKMPAPKNLKEVKQFLGLVGYYRKFVPRFADISRVLTQLTKKDVECPYVSQTQLSMLVIAVFQIAPTKTVGMRRTFLCQCDSFNN